MIEAFADLIPRSLLSQSGSVFCSGRTAFSAPSKLYILGLNPGGDPLVRQAAETIGWHTNQVLHQLPSEWSAYCDESWRGRPPGTRGLQPRILHLLKSLHLNPRHVPSSNVIFLRSTRMSTLERKFTDLASETWAFHRNVIEKLRIQVVLCFGHDAGRWVAKQLGANRQIDELVENNNRRWRSIAQLNGVGVTVVTATHPSIADWTAPETDPFPLVRRCLERSRKNIP